MFDLITVYIAVFVAGAVSGTCVTALIKYQHAARLNLRDARLRRDAQYEAAQSRKLTTQLRRELEMQHLLNGTDTTR